MALKLVLYPIRVIIIFASNVPTYFINTGTNLEGFIQPQMMVFIPGLEKDLELDII